MTEMTEFERINAVLVRRFNHELVRDPSLMARLDEDADVVPLLEGNEEFNDWSRRESRVHRDEATTVFVKFEYRSSSKPERSLPQHIAETQPDSVELQPAYRLVLPLRLRSPTNRQAQH